MNGDSAFDFKSEIREILSIPGVTKKKVAEWAAMDASSVTRWDKDGVTPVDPVAVLNRLRPYAEAARRDVASVQRTQVDSWRPLLGGMSPGLRQHVENSGLLASTYTVISSWIPSTTDPNEYDIVVVRYFDDVWADMSRTVYNLGDQSQTVSVSGAEDPPRFDQEKSLRDIAEIKVEVDREVGKSVARLHVQLGLEGFSYPEESIGFIEGFGYRFRATRGIARHQLNRAQTNDFLGAPLVIACRRFQLLVCIPKPCFRGSPFALSSSNRSMLKLLMELDNTEQDKIESLLWPNGRTIELSSGPDAPLKKVSQMGTMIDAMPRRLQEALKEPADFELGDGDTIQNVLCSSDSACFLLEVHDPHPSLTHYIVWRLPNVKDRV